MANRENDPRSAPNLEVAPAGYFLVVPPRFNEEANDAITLAKVAAIFRDHWRLLLAATMLGAAFAAVISLRMPNVYRAQAVLAPTQSSSGGAGGGLKSEFGGLAALAGIDLGGGGSRKVEALATLSSLGFVRDFILANDLMPILYSEKWDANARRWRSDARTPTLEEGTRKFIGIRNITENAKTGLVTMSVDWYSAELAAKWTNGMVEMLNERMRANDIRSTNLSLGYLDVEMAKASSVELRQAISHLIERQVNDQMLANVQREYAYHFIDTALAPERKVSPKRILITIGGAVIGAMLAFMFIVLRGRYARLPDSN